MPHAHLPGAAPDLAHNAPQLLRHLRAEPAEVEARLAEPAPRENLAELDKGRAQLLKRQPQALWRRYRSLAPWGGRASLAEKYGHV
jgi:hypothetical protein